MPGAEVLQAWKALSTYDAPMPVMATSAALAAGAIERDATRTTEPRIPATERFIIFSLFGLISKDAFIFV